MIILDINIATHQRLATKPLTPLFVAAAVDLIAGAERQDVAQSETRMSLRMAGN